MKRLGLAIVAASASLQGAAPTQAAVYHTADSAPAVWRDYAVLVGRRVQDWLGQDGEQTLRLRMFQEALSQQSVAPSTILVRLWILANGTVERVELEGYDPADAEALRALLARQEVGAPPPADMPQPLHLKLSLQAKN
ncbi:MAG TPA: hypothetical protein VIF40_07195 [Methylosinus sp.]|uniref:hypothetical protein n=1 Tax=Methylosinus sp. TaxID=427 RepID=UPI002F946589